jgi:hypothetical protein
VTLGDVFVRILFFFFVRYYLRIDLDAVLLRALDPLICFPEFSLGLTERPTYLLNQVKPSSTPCQKPADFHRMY